MSGTGGSNPYERFSLETDEQYAKRMKGMMSGYRRRPRGSVARDKRAARTRRNINARAPK